LQLATVFGLVALAQGDARAVPVFARKYQTSCQTCHTAFPKLTPFGEAFRRNGHRFPAGEEEDNTKQEPVAMGQEAHKKMFPSSVWPVDLPSVAPISITTASSFTYTENPASLSFASVGGTFGIQAAATLGDVFSVWAGASLMAMGKTTGGETVAGSLERLFVNVTPFDQPYATLKVGRIEPGVLVPTQHRTLGLIPWIGSSAIGDDPFTLDPTQLGIEASGMVLWGRLSYALGLVEGANALVNPPKDFYGRLAYKLGGMRMDGIGGATEADPWRETSATLGVFGYRGQAKFGDPALATQEDRFWLAGADLNVLFKDANLLLAFEYGVNHRPYFKTPNVEQASWNLFAQLDYVVFPWLIPTVRYERRLITADTQENRISGGVYFLIRANVRAQVLVAAQGPDSAIKFNQVLGGLNLAF
jgi:hypothetical protein